MLAFIKRFLLKTAHSLGYNISKVDLVKLNEVEKMAELAVGMAAIHAPALFEHTAGVHALLHLDDCQRQAIDQQGDVGAEVVLAVFEGKFGGDVPVIVVEIVEIDQTHARACGEALVKSLAEITGNRLTVVSGGIPTARALVSPDNAAGGLTVKVSEGFRRIRCTALRFHYGIPRLRSG